MTLAELAEASAKAGNALRAYRATWESWRRETKGLITGYQVSLGKEIKRLEKLSESLKGIAAQIAEMDRLVGAMTEPPILPSAIGAKVTVELTGEVVGMPPELRPIAAALSMLVHTRACGVYFLVRGASVVYVGKSVNVPARVASHTDKEFDRAFFLEVPEKQLDLIESAFIRMLRPEYNRTGLDPIEPADQDVIEKIAARCSNVPDPDPEGTFDPRMIEPEPPEPQEAA